MIYFALIILLLKTVGVLYELVTLKEKELSKSIGQVIGKAVLIATFVYCITVLVDQIKFSI